MKQTLAAAVALALSVGLHAAADPVLVGDYVEARTAEVFTGGCIMGSEGEVAGREALMAWKVRQGNLNGVRLDGLAVVALVAGDVNLSTHELGGVAPTSVKAVVMVDERGTPDQRRALVELARALAPAVVRDVTSTTITAIRFDTHADGVRVVAGEASLDVATNVEHAPECGAAKWFEPLARVDDAKVGMTRTFEWSGEGLGAQWKQFDRKSSYVGSFTIGR